jgi:hypothetical protein
MAQPNALRAGHSSGEMLFGPSEFLCTTTLLYLYSVQAIHYFRHYPTDKILVKITVLLAVICNTLIAVAGCGNCYIVGTTLVQIL